MAKNETGIAITIKAWLPTGKTLDEQYAALTVVKTAHESGDYAPLLGAAKIEAVLTDSKTRRVEEAPEPDPRFSEPATTMNPADNDGRYVDLSGAVADPGALPDFPYAGEGEEAVYAGPAPAKRRRSA